MMKSIMAANLLFIVVRMPPPLPKMLMLLLHVQKVSSAPSNRVLLTLRVVGVKVQDYVNRRPFH